MKRFFRESSLYLILLLIIISAVALLSKEPQEIKELDYVQLLDNLEKDNILSIEIKDDLSIAGQLKDKTEFVSKINIVFLNSFQEKIEPKIENNEIKVVKAKPQEQRSILWDIMPTIIVVIVLGVIWFMFMNQSQGGGGGKVMNFGKSNAQMHKDDNRTKITFNDVAGLKEEKEELKEIVDFLKDPRKYINIGARIPKGVLLVGPPGTGKTYLSRAVAGEAGVPFFSISGSDFVEMFVGVGASRVRDLFETAKKAAPCIIFIDEIDAVGRRRGAGLGGGHDEREQTLNQLLVEMDGFGTNEGIIVMAATNRPDILDPAILRPGRFDRRVHVGLPDVRAREAILKVHTRNKPLADDVNLKVVAKRTPGFSPADLENLTNEAALLTARNNLTKITMEIINEASIKVIAGPEKKSQVVTEKERKLTAYHEAGHAVVSKLLPESDLVHMITIIPRGGAGGFTAYLPEDDRNYMTKGQMKTELVSLLGGRVAETLALDDISTGAQNDIERATEMARNMITRYGMSDKLGPMSYGSDEEEVFVGRDIGRGARYSEDIASAIDKEIRALIDEAYDKAKELLSENMDVLDRVAVALLERETINGEEFNMIFNGEELPPMAEVNGNEETDDIPLDDDKKEEPLSEEGIKTVEIDKTRLIDQNLDNGNEKI